MALIKARANTSIPCDRVRWYQVTPATGRALETMFKAPSKLPPGFADVLRFRNHHWRCRLTWCLLGVADDQQVPDAPVSRAPLRAA